MIQTLRERIKQSPMTLRGFETLLGLDNDRMNTYLRDHARKDKFSNISHEGVLREKNLNHVKRFLDNLDLYWEMSTEEDGMQQKIDHMERMLDFYKSENYRLLKEFGHRLVNEPKPGTAKYRMKQILERIA